LDTPGILWPKFEDQSVGLKLALIGSIKDEILNIDEMSLELIRLLEKDAGYMEALRSRYGLDEAEGDAAALLMQVAQNRSCIKKGGELDTSKAAALLLDEFRSGTIGRMTLERPEEYEA
jgi:ribosome biogenesis GTPase A